MQYLAHVNEITICIVLALYKWVDSCSDGGIEPIVSQSFPRSSGLGPDACFDHPSPRYSGLLAILRTL